VDVDPVAAPGLVEPVPDESRGLHAAAKQAISNAAAMKAKVRIDRSPRKESVTARGTQRAGAVQAVRQTRHDERRSRRALERRRCTAHLHAEMAMVTMVTMVTGALHRHRLRRRNLRQVAAHERDRSRPVRNL
jgi:hypothetical protein